MSDSTQQTNGPTRRPTRTAEFAERAGELRAQVDALAEAIRDLSDDMTEVPGRPLKAFRDATDAVHTAYAPAHVAATVLDDALVHLYKVGAKDGSLAAYMQGDDT